MWKVRLKSLLVDGDYANDNADNNTDAEAMTIVLRTFMLQQSKKYWGQNDPYHLARGLIICGWSMIYVGLIHFSSIKSPTSCNK